MVRSGLRTAIAITVVQSVCCNTVFRDILGRVLCCRGRLALAGLACTAQPGARALSCACTQCAGYILSGHSWLCRTPPLAEMSHFQRRWTNYERRAETDHFCAISVISSSNFYNATAAAVSVRPGCLKKSTLILAFLLTVVQAHHPYQRVSGQHASWKLIHATQ